MKLMIVEKAREARAGRSALASARCANLPAEEMAVDLQAFKPTLPAQRVRRSGSQPPQDAGFAEPDSLCRRSRT